MFTWLKRYINGEADTRSEAALYIYRSLIVAAKPLTLEEIQAGTPIIDERVAGILATLVRNKMLVIIEHDGDNYYDLTPESYPKVKDMLQSIQISPAVRARNERRFADPDRFRPQGPRPAS